MKLAESLWTPRLFWIRNAWTSPYRDICTSFFPRTRSSLSVCSPSPMEAEMFTQIDYSREMAIIAETEENGRKKMARVVRIIADPFQENAEFAIVVADPWQKQGLGSKFTDYILEIAREMGLKRIYANFLKENFIMKHLFEKRNFKIKFYPEDDYYAAELELG